MTTIILSAIIAVCGAVLINKHFVPFISESEEITYIDESGEIEKVELKDLPPIDNLPPEVKEEIKDFRPFVQDIVASIYNHPEALHRDKHIFHGKGFGLWIANEYKDFNLWSPQKVELKPEERKHLHKLYKDSMDSYYDSKSLEELIKK